MNSTARISLLFGALILLVFGIVCLKQQLGPDRSPPAFVSPGSTGSAVDQRGFPGHQPTILSAEPSNDHDLSASSRPREISPVPRDEDHPVPFDFPVNTTLPEIPRELSPLESNAGGAAPSNQDARRIDSSTLFSAPEINNSNVDTRSPGAAPTSVVTTSNDSLWAISERVYGRSDFYKALFLHNRALLPRPDRIAAGIELATPSPEELRRLFPDVCPPAADSPAFPPGG